jgi:kynurenine formamidase
MGIRELAAMIKGMEMVELGQYLEEKMPTHPSHSKFYKMVWHSHQNGDSFLAHQIIMNEHNGTHVDSFAHCINQAGYEFIDQIPLKAFNGICVTMDASFLRERESLTEEHIAVWEKKCGKIKEGEIVLFDFGWMKYWDLRPKGGRFCADFPGLGKSGAEYLVKCGVKMVGVDTLGVDAWEAAGDPAHHVLLSNRIPVVENLCNLSLLHDKEAYFVMLPLLIRGGSASPVRPIALIEE